MSRPRENAGQQLAKFNIDIPAPVAAQAAGTAVAPAANPGNWATDLKAAPIVRQPHLERPNGIWWSDGVEVATQFAKSRFKGKARASIFSDNGFSPFTLKVTVGVAQYATWRFVRTDKVAIAFDRDSVGQDGYARRAILFIKPRKDGESEFIANTKRYYPVDVIHANGYKTHISLKKFIADNIKDSAICNLGFEFANVVYEPDKKLWLPKWSGIKRAKAERGPQDATMIITFPEECFTESK